VDVARAVLHGLEEERVDEPDDRRLVARLEEVARLLELGRDQVEALFLEVAHEIRRAAGREIVGAVDRLDDRGGRHHDRTDGDAVEHTQVVERCEGLRIAECHHHLAALATERQHEVPPRELHR
jgi:hypothetical protein